MLHNSSNFFASKSESTNNRITFGEKIRLLIGQIKPEKWFLNEDKKYEIKINVNNSDKYFLIHLIRVALYDSKLYLAVYDKHDDEISLIDDQNKISRKKCGEIVADLYNKFLDEIFNNWQHNESIVTPDNKSYVLLTIKDYSNTITKELIVNIANANNIKVGDYKGEHIWDWKILVPKDDLVSLLELVKNELSFTKNQSSFVLKLSH